MTIATLGGQPLLGSSPVRWTLRDGVRPVIQTFDVTPDSARGLLRFQKQPVSLVIDAGKKIEIKFLYILHLAPGENPNIFRVVVADRRWLWSYGHILRRYNMRRNVGFRRVPNFVDELTNVTELVWYADWSLEKPGGAPPDAKWNADRALKNLFEGNEAEGIEGILDVEKQWSGEKAKYVPRQNAGGALRELPIENLEIDDPGDQAAARLLAYMPEFGLFVDYDGDIVVYSRASGEEAGLFRSTLGPEMVGRGHAEVISYANIRPSKVRVLFTRECEVRFDFNELASSGSSVVHFKDERFADNVLPIPDFNLTVGGQKLAQNTWITVDQALNSWNLAENGGPPPGLGRLDHDLLQKAFVPHLDLWSALLLAGAREPRADWTSRIAALQQHYRRTYRVSKEWIDRILSLRAYLVATVDQSSGQRAPAIAFSDYALMGTQRSFFAERRDDADAPGTYIMNVDGYPATGAIDADTKPVPARVSVIDSDQGIIHLDYLVDPYRVFEVILPSKVVDAPCTDLKLARLFNRAGCGISFDSIASSGGSSAGSGTVPRLSPEHKVSFILTAIPASPNTANQLHTIEVSPDDVKNLLPKSLQTGLGAAAGPIMEIRIGAGVETARVRWTDQTAKLTEKCFGTQPIDDPVAFSKEVQKITVNAGDQVVVGKQAASLNAIALAAAARVYASMVDRYEGSATGNINRGLVPAGWVNEVDHEVSTKGDASSSIGTPETLPKFPLSSLLDSSTRGILFRLAQPNP